MSRGHGRLVTSGPWVLSFQLRGGGGQHHGMQQPSTCSEKLDLDVKAAGRSF